TLSVFGTAVFAGNSTQPGALLIIGLFLISTCLLGLSNAKATNFHVHGRDVRAIREPKEYKRRLDLAKDLIKTEANGRGDWAVQLGLVLETDLVGLCASTQVIGSEKCTV